MSYISEYVKVEIERKAAAAGRKAETDARIAARREAAEARRKAQS